MADVFENRRDLDKRRHRLWGLIEETPHLDWLLLTKRPENVRRLSPWLDEWPKNVWLGATAENQHWLDKRLPYLAEQRARVLFLSCEPLLGPLNLESWMSLAEAGRIRKPNWVIGGGESGHHARPMNPEWIASLRDQCVRNNIRFHFKQWGNWGPIGASVKNGNEVRTLFLSNGDRINVVNVGKKHAGRVLEGRTWNEIPETR
jgi:protein gp37